MDIKPKPMFRQADFDNLELVRQIVFFRLKSDTEWNQLDHIWGIDYGGRFVEFEHPNLRSRFVVLANEIMWQLITQGVITPGINANNQNLPFFRVTEYGRKVLEAERFIAHDPTGYLEGMRVLSGIVLGNTSVAYLEEALRCFNAGCHVAAVLLLGVAAEDVFLRLCKEVQTSLASAAEKKKLDPKLPVKSKHRWLVQKYQNLDSKIRNELPESLDVTLLSLYELIRRQRNDLGHPQENPPELTREEAFVFFRLFPGFVRDMEAFAQYAQSHGL